MFSKIAGRRTTALATTLAVVVGLAVTPAMAAAADEVPAVAQAPVAELVEVPAEPAPAELAPVDAAPVELAPPADPAPATDPAPLAEPVEAPAPQQLMGSGAPEPMSMSIQSAGIVPATVGPFVVGQPVDIQFSGADADRWRVSFDGFRGVDMSDSGHLTGSFSRLGSHSFTVEAQKWTRSWIGIWYWETIASKRYSFSVVPGVLTSSLPDATVGVGYSQTLDATRAGGALDSNAFTVTSGQLPPGLSLNRSTGRISGTVTSIPSSPVTYDFAVTLTVGVFLGGTHTSAPQPLSITVGHPAPVINPATLPTAEVGTHYSAALTATGSGVITWRATGLPMGLSIDPATGVISGTPMYVSGYRGANAVAFTVVADNGRASAPSTFVMPVATPAPELGSGLLPVATVGSEYDVQVPVTNAYGSPTFSITEGSLPAGLVMSATGRISGTPEYDAGAGLSKQAQVRIDVSGPAGSDSKVFTITLLTPATSIGTTSLAEGWWNQPYSQVIEATGPGVVVEVRGLPAGLTFDGTTITGSTRSAGTHTVTIRATNSAGVTERPLTLTVHGKPNLHRMPVVTMQTGEYFWGYPGLDGHQVTLALGAEAPAGMTLDSNHKLEWTPTAPGVYRFTIEASNQAGSDTQRYTFRVLDAPAIKHGTLDQGVINVPFTQQLDHDGTSVRFSVVRGDLPAGLKLTRAGMLKGTATEAGTFTFKVRAKNAVGVDSKWFTLTVLQPAMTLSSTSIIRGGSLTVNGSGYLPGDELELWLHSTPVLLGTVTATDGTFTRTVVIPANTPAGAHHLVVVGTQSGTHSVPLTVALPAVPPTTTPSTQAPTGGGAADTPDEKSAETDAEAEILPVSEPEGDDTAGGELPTLDDPVVEDEAAEDAPANVMGIIVTALALLLAALLIAFLLWRRRRAEG